MMNRLELQRHDLKEENLLTPEKLETSVGDLPTDGSGPPMIISVLVNLNVID